MNIEEIRNYCISKKHSTEDTPFGPDVLVFKVHNKMFALLSLKEKLSINLKCKPEIAIQLREQYPYVTPGCHMNKKHWNTIIISSFIFPKSQLTQWIDDSYNIIYNSLPKKLQIIK